jgi:hypothetical protein
MGLSKLIFINGEKHFQKPSKTMPKFGHGTDKWTKIKDLL